MEPSTSTAPYDADLRTQLEYAAQDPKSDFARQLKLYIQMGRADEEAELLGIDLAPFGRGSALTTAQFTPTEDVSRGLAGELVPATFAVGGGIVGSALGAPFGPAGVIGGGALGAGLGGTVGEGIQQGIETAFGSRTQPNVYQIINSGLASGLIQGLFPTVGKGVQFASKTAGPKLIEFMGGLSGYPKEVVKRALERTPGVVQGIKQGESALQDVVKQSAKNLQTFANKSLEESKKRIAELDKAWSAGTKQTPGTLQGMLLEGRNFATNISNRLRSQYNIGVERGKQLVFDRPINPSNIVSRSDQNAIQDAYNLLQGLKENTTIKNIDAVMERLMTLRSKTPGGTPTGGETKKIIGEMMSEVQGFARSLGNISQGYKEYADYLAENLPVRLFIREAKEIFGATGNLTAKEVSQIETRLLQTFNQGRGAVREFVEDAGKKLDVDAIGTVVGNLIKSGDEISVRAKNLTRRGLLEKVFEFIPRQTIQNYLKTGNMVGLEANKAIQEIAKVADVTAREVVQLITNLIQEKETK